MTTYFYASHLRTAMLACCWHQAVHHRPLHLHCVRFFAWDWDGSADFCQQLQEQARAATLQGIEALETAAGVSMGSAEQMEEDEDDEVDDEIDPEDEDEELAMQQPPVHDMHVSSEAALVAGTSTRDRVPDPSRSAD